MLFGLYSANFLFTLKSCHCLFGSTITAHAFLFVRKITYLLYVSVSGWLHWIELHTGPWRIQPSLEWGATVESYQWRVLCHAEPLHCGPHSRAWKPAASWCTSCDTIPDHIKKRNPALDFVEIYCRGLLALRLFISLFVWFLASGLKPPSNFNIRLSSEFPPVLSHQLL